MSKDKINTQSLIINLIKELEEINNKQDINEIERTVKDFLENELKDIKNDIDIEPIIEEALQMLKEVSNVKPISNNDNKDEILNDTINLCHIHRFESQLALESFKILSNYDKIFHADQGKFFYKIYQMLSLMVKYKELI